MKERILQFLSRENKSSSQFAEEIGVQPSSVSHILSGRNNPSLDFTMKMLSRYPLLRTDWLLFGKGSMYREAVMPSLFDNGTVSADSESVREEKRDAGSEITGGNEVQKDERKDDNSDIKVQEGRRVTSVIVFYSDMTFVSYSPGQSINIIST